jgi:hypothetical protein
MQVFCSVLNNSISIDCLCFITKNQNVHKHSSKGTRSKEKKSVAFHVLLRDNAMHITVTYVLILYSYCTAGVHYVKFVYDSLKRTKFKVQKILKFKIFSSFLTNIQNQSSNVFLSNPLNCIF